MEPRKETVRFIIKTVDGDDDEFKKSLSSTIEEVTAVAMARFKIEPSPDATYRLALMKQDGEFTTLDPAKTLLDEGVEDGGALWLGTEQAVGCPDSGPQAEARGAGSPQVAGTARPASPAWRNRHVRDGIQARA